MMDRGYKKIPALSRKEWGWAVGVFLWGAVFASTLFAGEREDEMTRSVLKEVAALAKKEPNLDRFGKSTLSQSAVILDLGRESQPVLQAVLRDRKMDWKVRFWVADILGYVGDEKSAGLLLKAAGRSNENKRVQARARKAAAEIRKRVNASWRRPSRPSQ